MKKLLVLSFFISCCYLEGNGQDSLVFNPLTPIPVPLGATESALDKNILYLINGFSTEQKCTPIVEMYKITEDKWSILSDKLINKQFASAEIVNENLYVFNGRKCDNNFREPLIT